jgi:hypothetical protein
VVMRRKLANQHKRQANKKIETQTRLLDKRQQLPHAGLMTRDLTPE